MIVKFMILQNARRADGEDDVNGTLWDYGLWHME